MGTADTVAGHQGNRVFSEEDFDGVFVFQQVVGDLPQGGQVLWPVVFAHSALVFSKGYIDDVTTAGKPAATSGRKPTFLQKERWKAIQKARRKGMSLRAIEREMGIHRGAIKKYLDA